MFVKKKTDTPYEVIIIGDFLKDLDDEHALIGAIGLQKKGFIKLVCVLANLTDQKIRARGAKGTLQQIGFNDIPVGVGSNGGMDQMLMAAYEGSPDYFPYLAEESEVINDGMGLLVQKLSDCTDKKVILVLQSSMLDASKLLSKHPKLLQQKLLHIAIMGGLNFDASGHATACDKAANNAFHIESAKCLVNNLQELNIPMVVTTREAVYAG
jgi:inosine-uridine nucleoside N-ribohydrolase